MGARAINLATKKAQLHVTVDEYFIKTLEIQTTIEPILCSISSIFPKENLESGSRTLVAFQTI